VVAGLSRLPSGDVQPEATAAHMVITKPIMIALPAQPALSRDQGEPTSPPALRAALARTPQQDPLPVQPRAQLAHTPMGRQLAYLAPPALLLVFQMLTTAKRVKQAPFPCRHGRHLPV
jgi:hypothetical protein